MGASLLLNADLALLHFFNGSGNMLLDQIVWLLSSGLTWVPLYLALFYIVMRNNETMPQIGLVVLMAILCIFFSDGLVDGIIKPLVARWRPSNDPVIKYTIEVVNNMRLKDYSFCSAHAANTMSLAVFFSLLIRSRLMTFTLVFWSLLNCWTRLYLGVHYPSDILCGLVLGVVVGLLVYLLYYRLYYKISPKIKYISNQYTSTGYAHDDLDFVMGVIMFILVYVLLRACIMMSGF